MTASLLSAEDIATHHGVSKAMDNAWTADRSMPTHRIDRLWKFQPSEVDDWVRGGGAATSERELRE